MTPAIMGSHRALAANATLVFRDGALLSIGGRGSTVNDVPLSDNASLAVLEFFVHEPDVEHAKTRFLADAPVLACFQQHIDALRQPELEFSLGCRQFLSRSVATGNVTNLAPLSLHCGRSLLRLLTQSSTTSQPSAVVTGEVFDTTVSRLLNDGVLAPCKGTIAWGDFDRLQPFCRNFGFSRGTPVDRYYLDQFLRIVRPLMSGRTAEIGGLALKPGPHSLSRIVHYTSLDLSDTRTVDRVADAHHAYCFDGESLDCVVALNVLEHCLDPTAIVRNMWTWLRPGGLAVCMVPTAQRVHRFPDDYWRFMPDGLNALFDSFSSRRLFVYGNPKTLVASYLGIAAEELTLSDLAWHHPDYPVAVCIIARKS